MGYDDECIVASAIRCKWYTKEEENAKGNVIVPWHYIIITGKSHGDCLDKLYKLTGPWSDYLKRMNRAEDGRENYIEEGFMTSEARFVDRTKALVLAKFAGQIEPDQKLIHVSGTKLHSEDLYPENLHG